MIETRTPQYRVGLPLSVRARGTVARRSGRRVCAEEGCETVLSSYNRSKHCSIHARPVFWRREVRTSTGGHNWRYRQLAPGADVV